MNWARNSRGDTLVEVALSLAILSSVLLGAFNVASAAFRQGQMAKERTQAANLMQEQAEALRNYRDANITNWDAIRTRATGSPFHMEKDASSTWQPASGPLISGIFTIRITGNMEPTTPPNMKARFVIDTNWEKFGGDPGNDADNNTSTITMWLADLGSLQTQNCDTGCP